jgi:hypothetical protein
MSKPKKTPAPMPLYRALDQCRESLAGAQLSAERFLRQMVAHALGAAGAPEQFRGVDVATLEKHSLLGFLGRALRWLELASRAQGVSVGFAAKAQAFAVKLPDAKTLRDIGEHADDYERGVGKEQGKWVASWPNRPGGVMSPGSVRTVGTSPVTVVEHGAPGTTPKVTVIIGSRLDTNDALVTICEMLDAVEAEHDRVWAHLAPAPPTTGNP